MKHLTIDLSWNYGTVLAVRVDELDESVVEKLKSVILKTLDEANEVKN